MAEITKEENWICTDPDQDQYMLDEGQNDSATVFTFKEKGDRKTIDITKYTESEITSTLASYDYRKQKDGSYNTCQGEKIDNALIAECIFEREIGY